MCFSATASFATSAVLVPLGLYGIHKALKIKPRLWPLAAIPLLFGIQQVCEGIEWVGLQHGSAQVARFAAWLYLAFSHGLWLGWTPIAAFAATEDPRRRQWLIAIATVGVGFALALYLPLRAMPERLSIQVINHSIVYDTRLLYDQWWPRDVSRLIYGVIVLVPFLLSARPGLIGFAALIGLSAICSRLFMEQAFVSIWCFFAAVLSIYLFGWLSINVDAQDSSQA